VTVNWRVGERQQQDEWRKSGDRRTRQAAVTAMYMGGKIVAMYGEAMNGRGNGRKSGGGIG